MLKEEFELLHQAFENRIKRKKMEWEKEIRGQLEAEHNHKFRMFDKEIEKRSYELEKIENLLNDKDTEITNLKNRLDEYGNLMIDMKNKNITVFESLGKFKQIQREIFEKITRGFNKKIYEVRKETHRILEQKERKIDKLRETLFVLTKRLDIRKGKTTNFNDKKYLNEVNAYKSEIEFLKSEKNKLNKEINYEREINKKTKNENIHLKSHIKDLIEENEKLRPKKVAEIQNNKEQFKEGNSKYLNYFLSFK